MLLGAIADDLTGATDLALMLQRGGMRTVQVVGVPENASAFGDYDAVVVALKSRTNPVGEALSMLLASADVLLSAGVRQLFFKYCSTFDSTDEGNIGPVADALMTRVGAEMTIACPAFPANGRSVYQGHLFVGDTLLSESPMKDHPLTPMRDSNLVRIRSRQTERDVGLIPYSVVEEGSDAVLARIEASPGISIVDAILDAHLHTIGRACSELKLVTGGSGVAIGLPGNFIDAGLMTFSDPTRTIDAPAGRQAILAGSCSAATRAQIDHALAAGIAALTIDPFKVADGSMSAGDVAGWADRQHSNAPALVYSSADPAEVRAVQDRLGRETAGELVARLQAKTAGLLARNGFTRFLVAGGETSGAVVAGLGVSVLEIGPEIDPGVPWTVSLGNRPLALALKSGNFGALDPARLSRLDAKGNLISGEAPTKESFLHMAMYCERPDALGIVHPHSTHSVAVSCLEEIDPDNVLPALTA